MRLKLELKVDGAKLPGGEPWSAKRSRAAGRAFVRAAVRRTLAGRSADGRLPEGITLVKTGRMLRTLKVRQVNDRGFMAEPGIVGRVNEARFGWYGFAQHYPGDTIPAVDEEAVDHLEANLGGTRRRRSAVR